MPFVIHCPHCRHGLSVHESQAGTVVACPTCRQSLTVPLLVPPSECHDRPTHSGHRGRRTQLSPALVTSVIVALLVAGLGGVGWWIWRAANDRDAPDSGVETAQKPIAQPSPTKPSKDPEIRPVTRPKQSPLTAPPLPPQPLTFEEAYTAAERLADQLDAEEPEKTEKACKLLTAPEMLQVQQWRNNAALVAFHRDGPRALRAVGLHEHLYRLSRQFARRDEDFKTTAKILWDRESGPAGVLRMMEEWIQIEGQWRGFAVEAVKSNRPTNQLYPEVRNAILRLGGRKWLER